MTRQKVVTLLAAGLLATVVPTTVVLSQPAAVALTEGPKTIFDGVYTEAQADRGKKLYGENCASCHGSQGGGGPAAPPLTGSALDAKETMMLSDSVEFMIAAMPPESPGKLRTREYVDVLAYILKLHGAPAGDTELPPKVADLDDIEIVAKPEGEDAPAAPAAAPAAPSKPAEAAPQPANDGH
ncbi:c-type cytochrome [Devosia sp. 2618]|uniref:c-type cytochrome n=1 Tax=Devosia sp. 2618 TaxID=3156454 RepID=UPI00339A8DA4